MILDKRHECMQRRELEQLQLERLESTLVRAYRNVAFYRRSFDSQGIDTADVRSPTDLARLPFTTRKDLEACYPYDMFALPLRDIVRIHSTSGTTGRPVVVGYSKNDLRHWSECTSRILAAADVTEHDVVQIAFEYSLFTGGFGFHQGAELLGASVIPCSRDTEERLIGIMRDYKSTALLCTPSFALRMSAALRRLGTHPEELSLRVGLFGAEPWAEGVRAAIESAFRIRAFDNYGLTEIMGPGVAWECEQRQGLHVNEDHVLLEVISEDTHSPLPAGQPGELVLTTLTKEGFPLIRYRTGDIAALLDGECPCGRTLRRISRIVGRTDDLIFFNGAKFFPSQIEKALSETEGSTPHFRVVLDREGGLDTMHLEVELPEEGLEIDELRNIERLRDHIAQRLARDVGVTPRISLVEPLSLRADRAKARRVEDRRA